MAVHRPKKVFLLGSFRFMFLESREENARASSLYLIEQHCLVRIVRKEKEE
jgi:hypothetical protein